MKFLFKLFALMLAGTVVATTSAVAAPAAKKTNQAAINSQYPNVGKVLSVLDTEMYTYIELAGKTDQDPSVWLATTKVKVEKGDSIRYGSGNVMNNFPSKSLNRTFATLIMIDKVLVTQE